MVKAFAQWGKIPAAGVVTGIDNVADVPCMIIANDATVKAGAFFPQTTKKIIRTQRIAFECALLIILPGSTRWQNWPPPR
jgi:3-methylcrotonyl-CoA carboxylase beta subunit